MPGQASAEWAPFADTSFELAISGWPSEEIGKARKR
jgi:hypothetical protein